MLAFMIIYLPNNIRRMLFQEYARSVKNWERVKDSLENDKDFCMKQTTTDELFPFLEFTNWKERRSRQNMWIKNSIFDQKYIRCFDVYSICPQFTNHSLNKSKSINVLEGTVIIFNRHHSLLRMYILSIYVMLNE